MTKQTYVEYAVPGILVSETSSRAVESRSIRDAVSAAPASAFCFKFYDRLTEVVTAFGEPKELHKRVDESPLYYIGGTVMDAAEVARLPGDNAILLSNMRGNGYEFVIQCRTGNFLPFYLGEDVLVSAKAVS